MKKFVIPIAIIVLFFVAGAATLLNLKGAPSQTKSTTQSTDKSNVTVVKACDVLTLEDAKSLIGANATLLPQASESNLASTDSVVVDNCSYSADGATLGDMMQIVLQVQSGSKDDMKNAYEAYKKEYPGEAVNNLGDEAYYSTDNQQAVVRKGLNWFFVGVGSMNTTKEQNKEQAIKAATIVVSNL